VHPWDFLAEFKNSLKNNENFQNCCDLEPMYQLVRTHFVAHSKLCLPHSAEIPRAKNDKIMM